MTNVVPLHRPTAAEARLSARLERAVAAVKPANEKLVGELVAAMVEAIGAGVPGPAASALAVGTINDVMQDFAAIARRAQEELDRMCRRIEGEPS